VIRLKPAENLEWLLQLFGRREPLYLELFTDCNIPKHLPAKKLSIYKALEQVTSVIVVPILDCFFSSNASWQRDAAERHTIILEGWNPVLVKTKTMAPTLNIPHHVFLQKMMVEHVLSANAARQLYRDVAQAEGKCCFTTFPSWNCKRLHAFECSKWVVLGSSIEVHGVYKQSQWSLGLLPVQSADDSCFAIVLLQRLSIVNCVALRVNTDISPSLSGTFS
jgi:hypothetical protein